MSENLKVLGEYSAAMFSGDTEAVFDFCRREKLDRVVFRTRATNEPMKAVLARVGFVPAQILYEKAIELSDKKAG